MRMLILGGTRFIGPPIVDAALAAGWHVTTFNRGQSGPDAPDVEALHGDRGRTEDLGTLRTSGPWDVAVDLSGYIPRDTLNVCQMLEASVARYVFMSTVSVYEDWPVRPLTEKSRILECPVDAGPDFGIDVEDGPTRYGYQKAGCENAARLVFGEGRVAVLRPGIVLGPREYVGRLPWWLTRIARGGPVVAPGESDRAIQAVDVRDLAQFSVHLARHGISGTYNVTGPIGRDTFGNLLENCIDVTGVRPELVWAPDKILLELGVRQWSEMPLWRTFPGVWNVDASGAYEAGLSCRALEETVRDTWVWLRETTYSFDDERAGEIGLDRKREEAILRALR